MGRLAAIAIASGLLLVLPATAAAEFSPDVLWQGGENCNDSTKLFHRECFVVGETEAGESFYGVVNPRGVASSPLNGHVYLVDGGNTRIIELDAWGRFERAWGWGVRDGSSEAQACTLLSGCVPVTGSLGFGAVRGLGAGGAGEFSAPQGIAVDSQGDVYVVDASTLPSNNRIQKFDPEGNFLRTWGGGVVSGGAAGSGDLTAGSTRVVNLATTAKAFEIGQAIEGAGISAGTTVSDLGIGTLTLSKAATATATGVALTAPEGAGNVPVNERKEVKLAGEGVPTGGTFTLTFAAGELAGTLAEGSSQLTETKVGTELTVGSFHVGDTIKGQNGGLPPGTTIAAIDTASGSATLSAPATQNDPFNRVAATETTAAIPYNASAAEVQAKLEALAAIGAGNVAVEGAAGGPWTVEFKGPLLGDVNLEPAGVVTKTSGDGSSLTPAGATVKVTTVTQGASGAEVCATAAECRAGVEGPGPGQFKELPLSAGFIAAGAGDKVYVGDRNRIQIFDPEGQYTSQVSFAALHASNAAFPAEGSIQSLAADADPASPNFGELYAIVRPGGSSINSHNVFRIDPAAATVSATIEDESPRTVAVAPGGGVFLFEDAVSGNGNNNDPRKHQARLVQFDAGGKLVSYFGEGEFYTSLGLATGSACYGEGYGLYVGDNGGPFAGDLVDFFRAYGQPPDKVELCPPPKVRPSINDQYASSVGTVDATVAAKINPHFWDDTTYRVQYGTSDCALGGCQERPEAPGARLSRKMTGTNLDAHVVIEGLQPGTTYHYRFVSESSGGGPSYGKDRTFTTYPVPATGKDDCPNRSLRTGASAALPDCRAYEMVSPTDKNGGSIVSPPNITGWNLAFYQSAEGGEGVTYSSGTAFAGSQTGAYVNQYLARRGGEGWATEALSPPRGDGVVNANSLGYVVDNTFAAFSPDLASAYLRHDTDPPLTPDGIENYLNLYRRDNTSGTFEALTTVQPPTLSPDYFTPHFEGATADGSHLLYAAPDKLTADARNGEAGQIYELSGGPGAMEMRLVSIFPDGAPSVKGTWQGGAFVGSWGGSFHPHLASNLRHAVSADGSDVYWSTGGVIYLRTNAGQPESAHLHGVASGTGDVFGPAECTGAIIEKFEFVSKLECKGPLPVVGQEIADSSKGIPAGTKVKAIEGPKEGLYKLTLTAKATKTVLSGDEIFGIASATVANLTTETGAFQVGQEVEGAGIATGTTVTGVNAAEHKLTLSAKATLSGIGVALEATSPCTEAARACTYPVSAAAGSGQAAFLEASADGSRALFAMGVASDTELYEYERATGEATLVAHGLGGWLGASEDLERAYFASGEVLTPGEANGAGEEAQKGQQNIYLREGGSLAYVATLRAGDSSATRIPFGRTSRVSPDGAHLAFMSSASLSGYDNRDVATGEADTEVYLYDAEGGRLECASCNPSGARPIGRNASEEYGKRYSYRPRLSGAIPGWQTSFYAQRALAGDGSRLFFESADALVPRDTNGAFDVYEWEEPGHGSCSKASLSYFATNGGCIYLISTGENPVDAVFADADPDGENVFFTTAASLAPQDVGLVDLYDARVEGGYPPPPAPPAACEGEACQGLISPPDDPTPSSESFEGAGNVQEEAPVAKKPKPCGKGKVKRHGKCVRKHQRHAKKHKRSHKRRAHAKRRAGR